MEKTYQVNGMSCVICKSNVESCLNKLDGVNSAIVSLMDNEVLIDYDETIISEEMLAKTVKDNGYELIINQKRKIDTNLTKLIISIVLTVVLMINSMLYKDIVYSQAVLALIIIILNINYYKSGFKSLVSLKPNMDSLVSISSLISYLYSIFAMNKQMYHLYFETSAMVLVIVSIGKYIEAKNKKKTTKFIRGLSTLIPMQANLLVDNKIVITPIEQIKKGDHILIKPGEAIPQDGVVLKGISSTDESMITGESLPSKKQKDSLVIGGTINIDGELIVEVNKNSNQTTLSKIVSLTKQASMSKISIERFADRIANKFVYFVLFISIVSFIVWYVKSNNLELSLNFALSVLVISCPCALGLATPSAIAVACNTSSKNAVLIKNPEVLEIAYKLKTLIVDKTGTLTENSLEIVNVKEYDTEFSEVISSIEASSNHPIANAIKEIYKENTLTFDSISQVSGEGIIAKLNRDTYLAGNKILLKKYNIDIDEEYAIKNNYSYIGVAKNNKLLGIVYLKDKIKRNAHKAISNLKKNNIKVIMATGDNDIAAKTVANELNIDEYVANVKPQDKQKLVLDSKENGITGMIGDGINDAIALTSSDIAFTLASGTDIANASGDISLLTNDLDDINFLIKLSRKTMHIIKQNLFWALGYNALFIPLAAGCFYEKFNLMLNPMIGSITMSISSIVVISNALRIAKIKKEK